jgi:large subunit ribosomal protein L21
MFAVIKTGGRQYRVVPDDVLEITKIAGDVGTIVQLGEVLLVGGEKPILGMPTVDGASVAAEVLQHKRGPKIISFKKRRRKNSRRKRGYRDEITVLRITEILTGGQSPHPETVARMRRREAPTPEKEARPVGPARSFPDAAKGLFRKSPENVSTTPSAAGSKSGYGATASLTSQGIVEDLGNPSADKRVAALARAAEVICDFDRSKKMDKSERLREATLPRRIYEKLFDPDSDVARQAAYSLVVSSKSFGGGRKLGQIKDLKRTEIDSVRRDLQQLLPKLGTRFFSYVEIRNIEQGEASFDASIRIRISRKLPFRMNDDPVIVDGPPPAPKDAEFTLMSVSSAQTEVKRRYVPTDKEWADGDLFIADCRVHLPLRKGQTITALPIAFAVDGLGSTRRELKIETKAKHRAA